MFREQLAQDEADTHRWTFPTRAEAERVARLEAGRDAVPSGPSAAIAPDASQTPQPSHACDAPSASSPARRARYIEVRNSPVHGRGVFALTRIPAETNVAEYTGERLTWGQADVRYADEHGESGSRTYLMSLGKRYVLDATRSRCRAKWLNHSCEPNCEALIDGGRVFIYTLREIAPGEELFLDYALEGGEPDEAPLYRCLCRSTACRGTMLALPANAADGTVLEAEAA